MSDPIKPWCLSTERVLEAVQGDEQQGLASEQARERFDATAPNELQQAQRPSAWRRWLSQFRDITVLALLGAAILAFALAWFEATEASGIERFGDSMAILMIVVLNAVIGFVQEERAHQAMSALQDLVKPTATVIRDGHEKVVAARELVVGDLIALAEGDRVPADARLLSEEDLHVSEASLTGESVPAEKRAADRLQEDTPLAERSNMLFMSSHAVRGSGRAVVTAVGMKTEIGRIAQLLKDVDADTTPLERQMTTFGRRVVIGCGALAVVMFLLGSFTLDVSVGFLILVAVSLAVAAIPEGLPAITTVVLAMGVRRMADANAIVRRLSAVEALGAAHVICSDKTGTLTQNRMSVVRLWSGGEEGTPEELDSARTTTFARLIAAAQFAPAARPLQPEESEHGSQDAAEARFTGDPTDAAALELHARHGNGPAPGEVVRVLPFSSDRRLASVLFAPETGPRRLICHGAPEHVVELCRSWVTREGEKELAAADREQVAELLTTWAKSGYRVLGWAERELPSEEPEQLEEELTLVGLVALADPPRPEVAGAIEKARGAGVRTLMITGDHPLTARAIAEQLGIATPDSRVVVGSELQAMSESELVEALDHIAVVARATAEDKLKIVRAMERRNEVAAMTGDGVNDAPAIKASAIGIAMGKGGTDVCREVADVVLADDNYATIVRAIEEGRAIYENIQRFVTFLFAVNTGLVLFVVVAMLLGWPPVLTPTQILWINLITNGPPALALGMEPAVGDPMQRPPRDREANLVTGREWSRILVVGVALALVGLGLFQFSLDRSLDHARSTAFTALALGPVLYAFSARSERSLFEVSPFSNRTLWGAVLLSVALQALALYMPGVRVVFATVPLSWEELGWALLAAAAVIPVAEALKAFLRFRRPKAVERA